MAAGFVFPSILAISAGVILSGFDLLIILTSSCPLPAGGLYMNRFASAIIDSISATIPSTRLGPLLLVICTPFCRLWGITLRYPPTFSRAFRPLSAGGFLCALPFLPYCGKLSKERGRLILFCPFAKGDCVTNCTFRCHRIATSSRLEGQSTVCLIAAALDSLNDMQADQLSEAIDAIKERG